MRTSSGLGCRTARSPSAELLVTSPARTLSDLARCRVVDGSGCSPDVVAVRAAEVAVQRGLLTATQARATSDVARLLDATSESALETGVRLGLVRRGFRVLAQVEVREPRTRRLRRLDLVVEGPDGRLVVVECGGSSHDGRYDADRARDEPLERTLGLVFVYVTWRDLLGGDAEIARRVTDALVLARPADAELVRRVRARQPRLGR